MNTNFTQRRIIVIGTFNTDMVIKAVKFPLPGETVLGEQFLMNPGGKGANQAISAARLGGDVSFVARVGYDIFGRQALQQLQQEEIDTKHIKIDEDEPSGVAIINVDENGETRVAVSPGANNNLGIGDVELVLEEAEPGTIVLLQFGIPLQTVEYVILKSNEKGLKVVLNPGPVQVLAKNLYPLIYAIIPNEVEAESLTGIRVTNADTARHAAMRLKEMGLQNVIITLGLKGAFVDAGAVSEWIPAPDMVVIDSTGAVDSFCGAFAVALSEDVNWDEATIFAAKAAAISAQQLGAQTSIPYRMQVEEYNYAAIA